MAHTSAPQFTIAMRGDNIGERPVRPATPTFFIGAPSRASMAGLAGLAPPMSSLQQPFAVHAIAAVQCVILPGAATAQSGRVKLFDL